MGTALGYSTVLLASAFPTASIYTTETDPAHTEIARATFKKLGLDGQITILAEPEGQYDIVFVDGGRPGVVAQGGLLISPAVKDAFSTVACHALRDVTDEPVTSIDSARAAYTEAARQLIADARANAAATRSG